MHISYDCDCCLSLVLLLPHLPLSLHPLLLPVLSTISVVIDILWCVKRDVAEQSKAKQKSYKVVVSSRRGAAIYVELLAGKNAFWAPIDGDL